MQDIKQLRKDIRETIEFQNRLKQEAYRNYDKVINSENKDDVYISWQQLETMQIGETVKHRGVEFIKRSATEKEMVFNTFMFDGGTFENHFHNCVEICTVLQGTMIEKRKGDRLTTKVYKEGDRAIYDAGELHSMYANEYTILEVRFIKNL